MPAPPIRDVRHRKQDTPEKGKPYKRAACSRSKGWPQAQRAPLPDDQGDVRAGLQQRPNCAKVRYNEAAVIRVSV